MPLDTILLSTKFRRPALASDLVPRPRLVARLEEHPERALTLIVAPAGYGKSTLLSKWLERKERVAWLSLDESVNDLALFLRYLVAALDSVFPNAFHQTLALLAGSQGLSVEILASAFVNEMDELPAPVIFVLDDWHSIHDNSILEFLSILIQNQPPNLHLVIATRTDPTLPLARTRARGQLVELRAADLRFTSQEAETFLEGIFKTGLDAELVVRLDERVEGWAAGLRLLALSTRDPSELATIAQSLEHKDRMMQEYLTDEVLARQSADVRIFLRYTASVDRFCLPLARALLENTTLAAPIETLFEEIQKQNLFIVPLDGEGKWFRFHHLFQNLLQERLSRELDADQMAALHRRASEWFEQNGSFDEALAHALKAHTPERAARLIETHAPLLLNREDWRTVQRWLAQLPEPMVEQRPLLILIRGWIWLTQWKNELLRHSIKQVESELESGALAIDIATERLVRSFLYAFRAHLLYWTAEYSKCLQFAQLALDLAPAQYRFLRGLALTYAGLALQALGRKRDALNALDRAMIQDGERVDQYTMRLLLSKSIVHYLEIEFAEAEHASQYFWNLAKTENLGESLVWANNRLGRVYYDRNQLERALFHYLHAKEYLPSANLAAAHSSLFGLALVYQALGNTAQADEIARRAHQLALDSHLAALLSLNNSFAARLALVQGRLDAALTYAQSIPLEFVPNAFVRIQIPALTKVDVMIAEGSPASLDSAYKFWTTLVEFCARTHDKRHTAELLAMGALLEYARGNLARALQNLTQAVALARAGQLIRIFVDRGRMMRDLLQRLAQGAPADPYLERILAAFGSQDSRSPAAPTPPQILLEPLTEREAQILALLQARLSDKEIAQELSISPLTVRKHLTNLSLKLGVSGRRQAVAAGIEYGLLKTVPPR